MNPHELMNYIKLTTGAATYTQTAAWGLFAALAVLSLVLTNIRAAISGSGRDTIEWVSRFLFVLFCLAGFDFIFMGIMQAGDSLSAYLSEMAGWDSFWVALSTHFVQIFNTSSGETSMKDRLLGLVQGYYLSWTLALSYYLAFMAFRFVAYLTGIFASVLHVLGPLMIVGGLFEQGKTLRTWLESTVMVALWPIVPPIIMFMIVKGAANALDTENTVFIISQNLVLAFMAFLSPLVVSFLIGRAGFSSMVGAVTAAGLMATKGGVSLVGQTYGLVAKERGLGAALAQDQRGQDYNDKKAGSHSGLTRPIDAILGPSGSEPYKAQVMAPQPAGNGSIKAAPKTATNAARSSAANDNLQARPGQAEAQAPCPAPLAQPVQALQPELPRPANNLLAPPQAPMMAAALQPMSLQPQPQRAGMQMPPPLPNNAQQAPQPGNAPKQAPMRPADQANQAVGNENQNNAPAVRLNDQAGPLASPEKRPAKAQAAIVATPSALPKGNKAEAANLKAKDKPGSAVNASKQAQQARPIDRAVSAPIAQPGDFQPAVHPQRPARQAQTQQPRETHNAKS